MPLQLPNPPSGTSELIAQALRRVATAGGAAKRVTQVDDPSLLGAALPHRVYHIGSDDIVNGLKLEQAELTAWRFLIVYGQQVIAATELACDASGENLRFSSLDTGPFAQATRDVVARAETSPEVIAGSYELRVVKAPSVYAMAVWLKNLTGPDDIVIPMQPESLATGFSPASGGGPSIEQSPESFLGGLLPAASTSGRFDSSPSDDTGAGGAGGAGVLTAPPPPPPPPPRFPPDTFNRQAFIKSYANLVARTWADDRYLQELLADPEPTLVQAGLRMVPGAVLRIIQHELTGMGRMEDQVNAWIEGARTGLYDLFLPIKPRGVEVSGGAGAMGGGDACCCCSPCCCCT